MECVSENRASVQIKEIFNNPDWKSHVDDRLRFTEYIESEDANESLDQLIRWYVDKKSKRVGYAGPKLKNSFLTLPAVEQKKVGLALLTGGKIDTEWVCRRIINWHSCYASAVEDCWNKFHGTYCGRLLIQYLEEDVVRNHLDELNSKDFYFGLCRRFINKPWFQLDTEKLRGCTFINAYLFIMSKTVQGVSAEEAELLLYQWIAVLLAFDGKKLNKLTPKMIFWRDSSMEFRVINAWGIDTALYYLLCMNHDDVVNDFLKWDRHISEQYINELGDDGNEVLDEDKFREVIIKNFPDDKRYLLNLNTRHYEYINAVSQPFTKPRLYPWSETMEQEIPMYLSESEELKQYEMSVEEYNKLLNENPDLKSFVEKFDLVPINDQDIE